MHSVRDNTAMMSNADQYVAVLELLVLFVVAHFEALKEAVDNNQAIHTVVVCRESLLESILAGNMDSRDLDG